MTFEEITAEIEATKKAYQMREIGSGARLYAMYQMINALPEEQRIAAYKIYNARPARPRRGALLRRKA
jgi:hypothetical protein